MFKNFPKFNDQSYIHYITTKTFENFQYFKDEKRCLILLKELDFYRKKLDFKVLGYVIMPDHLHCLIWWDVERYPELTISKIMRGVKSFSAKRMLEYFGKRNPSPAGRRGHLTSQWLGQATQPTQKEYFHQKAYPHRRMSEQKFRIWQPNFYDFNIYTEQKFLEKLNYIHDNPRRAGLCENLEDYKWSSYKQIEDLDPNPIFRIDFMEI